MSTKRQVSRFRNVVDVPRVDRRDPRFSSLSAGQVNTELHSKGYAFLPELLEKERRQLRDDVKRLLKLERTCKLVEKPGVIAEREEKDVQLSKVLNRLSALRREQAEREAVSKVKHEEREKREQGKGAWFMKKCECPVPPGYGDRQLTTRSGEEGPAPEGPLRADREERRQEGRQQGYREEEEKGRRQGEEVQGHHREQQPRRRRRQAETCRVDDPDVLVPMYCYIIDHSLWCCTSSGKASWSLPPGRRRSSDTKHSQHTGRYDRLLLMRAASDGDAQSHQSPAP